MLKSISAWLIVACCCSLPNLSSAAGCQSADAPCWKRLLDGQLQLDDSLKRELALKDQLLASKDQQITILTSTVQEQATALTDARGAIKHAERSWVEDPRLWFGGGVLVGILTVAITAVALHYTLH